MESLGKFFRNSFEMVAFANCVKNGDFDLFNTPFLCDFDR